MTKMPEDQERIWPMCGTTCPCGKPSRLSGQSPTSAPASPTSTSESWIGRSRRLRALLSTHHEDDYDVEVQMARAAVAECGEVG